MQLSEKNLINLKLDSIERKTSKTKIPKDLEQNINPKTLLRFNYRSIFLIVIGGILMFIALSPLISYELNINVFHKYQIAITRTDPSPAYFNKLIKDQTILTKSKYQGYFYLSIPSINLENVPVKTNVNSFNTAAYEHVLTSSLAQMKGTALPGEYGNVYIYGHSAPLWFNYLYPKSFLGIFTNIINLKPGANIDIHFKGKIYIYKIFASKIVQPNDFSVLQFPKGTKYLTLMTCIPPGIGTQRYIVQARLIG
ncbi:MAG: sortase [Patescibacteria group bacterium]